MANRTILDGIDLEVMPGRSIAILGPSGSGKTTLLHCIAGLHPLAGGEIRLGNELVSDTSERRRAQVRLEHVGMVFQFGELLPELSLLENVALPLRLLGNHDARPATQMLEALGLGDRAASRPAELSGGEIQRAAIARALVGSPTLLLADEPTGALDEDLSRVVCEILLESTRHVGAALVAVTHDPLVASAMDMTMRLRQGKLEAT